MHLLQSQKIINFNILADVSEGLVARGALLLGIAVAVLRKDRQLLEKYQYIKSFLKIYKCAKYEKCCDLV